MKYNLNLKKIFFRCGALHPGDQLLAFDDHVIDGNNYTAEEVMCYLENCEAGFTRLHIAPRHVLAHGGRFTRGKILKNIYIFNYVYLTMLLCNKIRKNKLDPLGSYTLLTCQFKIICYH